DGYVSRPEHVGTKPLFDGSFVGFEHVFGQTKALMEKCLVVLVRAVEIPDQPQQPWLVKAFELCLHIGPRGARLRTPLGHAPDFIRLAKFDSAEFLSILV